MTVERHRSQLRQRGVPESSTQVSITAVEDLVILVVTIALILASTGIAHFLGYV